MALPQEKLFLLKQAELEHFNPTSDNNFACHIQVVQPF